MASLINRYFQQNQWTNEQSLVNSLNIESVQILGRQYYYLPRDSQIRDDILGEDTLSSFGLAIPVEMYLQDADGFTGQKEMFTRFGLQINNSYKLVISVDRWNTEVSNVFSSTNPLPPYTKTNYQRPWEGDLIYDPLTRFLMVIKFVDHDANFYQLGKNYTYTLSCEAFNYQNEKINTGVADIDAFNALSSDLLDFQILDELGDALILEDQVGYLLQDDSPTSIRTTEIDYQTPALGINMQSSNPFNF